MNVQFIGQGFEESQTVGDKILASFSDESYSQFTIISAFASQGAVLGIANILDKTKDKWSKAQIIVGIDQKGTSKEALEALLLLPVPTFVYFTSSTIIFHPKIYSFEGEAKTRLIVGSSNLTINGLFRNLEASLILDFDNSDIEGVRLLGDVQAYIQQLNSNLKPLTLELIDVLVEGKIVPTELERKDIQGKQKASEQLDADPSVLAQIKSIFPYLKLLKISSEMKRLKSKKEKIAVNEEETFPIIRFSIEKGALVWQKHNLPSSDSQQTTGKTNVTGVLRLGQADFKIDNKLINKNTYFKEDIFGHLDWIDIPRKNNSPLSETYAHFNLLIDNQDFGIFNLRISHDPERISGQANVPTTLHWGSDIIKILKNQSIIGKRLSLYAPFEESNIFTIDIL
jgi:HKD family nuclease